MASWDEYTVQQVLTDSDKYGKRLAVQFLKDYFDLFGVRICHTCSNFPTKFQKYIKAMKNNNTEKTGYVLKKMYENIPLKFGSPIHVNNKNMTKEYAETLIELHPRGQDLFDSIPVVEEIVEKIPAQKKKKNTKKA